MIRRMAALLLFMFMGVVVLCQQDQSQPFNGKQFSELIIEKAGRINSRLNNYYKKIFRQTLKQEKKIRQKLNKIDSSYAGEVFDQLKDKKQVILFHKERSKMYIPHADSIET